MEIAEILIANKADIIAKNDDGKTARDIAVEYRKNVKLKREKNNEKNSTGHNANKIEI